MAITRPKAHQIDFDLTNITDPLVRLNSGQTTANDKDIGLVLERGSDTNVALIWDESADEFALINTSEDGTTNGNVTISSYASIRAGTFYGDGSGLTGVTSYTDSDVATYLSSNGYDTATNIVASITDSAPGTLDTLNELAAALGDDANFSTTVTTSIGEKLAKASNLSDLTNTTTARSNLGLGSAATTASTDYATSAQGTTADAALARSGGTITGDVTLSGASILVADNEAVRFGAGQDLVIFHDGVGGGSYINEAGSGDLYIQGANIQLRKYGSSEVMADFNVDGAVDLYYDNSKKLATTSTGVSVTGELLADTVDATTLQIGGTSITATATELNYNDITVLGGVQASKTVTADSSGYVNFADNQRIRLGTGADLQIYHDASNSYIKEDGTGSLLIWSTGTEVKFLGGTGAETMLDLNVDGSVDLYYDSSKKLATSSTGITVDSSGGTPGIKLRRTDITNSDVDLLTGGGATGKDFLIKVNQSERVRIDEDGNVGIGSSNPAVPLHVYKSTSTTSSTTGTTLARFDNYVGGDLNQQKTFIDFKFQDDNANNSPQVRIGAEVGQNGDANTTLKEGSGAFVVYTNNATDSTADTVSGMGERFRVDYAGNVGIGVTNPSYKLEVNGTIHGSGNITTGGVFSGTATSAQYADLAEKYLADEEYEPGTVLIIGGDAEVTACEKYRDSRLAGVVSTNPAYLMNTNLQGENVVELALMGRVPCKVTGLINKGDLLTTSSTKGVATVYNSSDYIPGTIIGKALESYSDSSVGVIEILVGKV